MRSAMLGPGCSNRQADGSGSPFSIDGGRVALSLPSAGEMESSAAIAPIGAQHDVGGCGRDGQRVGFGRVVALLRADARSGPFHDIFVAFMLRAMPRVNL